MNSLGTHSLCHSPRNICVNRLFFRTNKLQFRLKIVFPKKNCQKVFWGVPPSGTHRKSEMAKSVVAVYHHCFVVMLRRLREANGEYWWRETQLCHFTWMMKPTRGRETKRQRLGNCIKKQTRDNFIAQFPPLLLGQDFLCGLFCIAFCTPHDWKGPRKVNYMVVEVVVVRYDTHTSRRLHNFSAFDWCCES